MVFVLLSLCRPGPASAVLVLAARLLLWLAALRFLVVFEGLWLPVRSLFRRFLQPCPGTAVFLVGFEGTVRHPASLNVRLFFGPFWAPWLAAPWPCLSCSCAYCRALAARPWRVFLVGFEGSVRHPPSSFSVPFCTPCTAISGGRPGWLRPGRALAALVLAAGLWLRGPGESSSWVSKVPLGTLEASIFGSFSVPFCTPCHCACV